MADFGTALGKDDETYDNTGVAVNHSRLRRLGALLEQKSNDFKPVAWTDYMSATAGQSPVLDLSRLLYELAWMCSQQGGFIVADSDGKAVKWGKDGSGAKALVETMTRIRETVGVPGLNFHKGDTDYLEKSSTIKNLLGDAPFAFKRMRLMDEFAAADNYGRFKRMIDNHFGVAPYGDEPLLFDQEIADKIAAFFPESFTEDPLRKKLNLTLVLASSNMNARHQEQAKELGDAILRKKDLTELSFDPENIIPAVTLDISAPADYRLPQTLVQLGIIKIDKSLEAVLTNEELMDENDPRVEALRQASIDVVDRLNRLSGLSVDAIDYLLWAAPRDAGLMAKLGNDDGPAKKLPHMMVQTLRF